MAINIRQYRFTIINEDAGTQKILDVAPGGWESVEERIYRHEDYHGILFEDETSLKYPKIANDGGGYQFIIDAYEAKGVKANLYLKREYLNPYTNGYEDDSYRKFDFDVDTGWTKKDEYFEIKTIESSDVNKLLVRDEIEYDMFSLKSSDNITVKAFENAYKEALYKKIDIYLDADTYGYFNTGFNDGTTQLTVKGTSVGNYTDTKYVNYTGFVSDSDIDDRLVVTDDGDTSYLYENTFDEDISSYLTKMIIDYAARIRMVAYSESSNYFIRLFLVLTIYDDEGSLKQEITLQPKDSSDMWFFEYSGGLAPISDPDLIDIDADFEFERNYLLEIKNGYRVDFRTKAILNTFVYNKNVAVSFSFFTNQNYIRSFSFSEVTSGRDDNNIKGMMVHEVVTRQMQLMTSNTTDNVVYAPVLGNPDSEFQTYTSDGYLSREHFTNGYLLRQFVNNALNMSFKDTFKSLDCVYPLGLWFDPELDCFYMDKIEKFYKTEVFSFVLEEIKDVDMTPAKYFYFNEIESGYPVIDHEDFQGVKEVNTETAHQISIETSSKLDARSVYNTGSIGIELARRKNKDTAASEDTKYDSEIFFTKLNSDYETIQGELEDLEGFSGISEYYNLTKTPRQNLQRQFRLYQAALFKDSTEIVQFTSSEKDNDISYTDPQTGDSVNEYDDIEQTGETLIKPEFYEFQGKYNRAIRQEIKSDPHRVLPYIDNDGNTKYGYIWEITGSPYRGVATYKLIRANEERLSL